jgi:GNAT superfamily N-acetyltransferase
MDELDLRLVVVDDERKPLARQALELIADVVGDVQPVRELLWELEEKRLGMPSGGDYHLLAFVDGEGLPVAAGAGVYLGGVNAGFITYLAVRKDQRGAHLGRRLRAHVVQAMRDEAVRTTGHDLAWIVGEVRQESPWLKTLVRDGEAVPFDMPYFHPWQSRRGHSRYVLYREPVSDERLELGGDEVLRLLYNIYRRAYRLRFPLQSDNFCFMLGDLEGRDAVGVHANFEELLGDDA